MTEIEHQIEIGEQIDTNSSAWMAEHKPTVEANTQAQVEVDGTLIQEEMRLASLKNQIAATSNALVAQRGQPHASEYMKKLVELVGEEEGGINIIKELHGKK